MLMPYAVWLELKAPTPVDSEAARAHLPDLLMGLIKDGWEVAGPIIEFDHASEIDHEISGPELLDVRVLTHPEGALIGLAVDTESVDVATATGTRLGRHIANAAPTLLGWTTSSLRADWQPAPGSAGRWLQPLSDYDDVPHLPVAEHLHSDLLELSAQYLLAGAVLDLSDPTGETRYTGNAVDAADLIAGACRQHPWDREITSALGTLLIAAGRYEAETVTEQELIGRGGGDAELARKLLNAVRSEINEPRTDDDIMRGHVLVETFMEDHDLQWNRVPDGVNDTAAENINREQLRMLLWAGLRTLATLSHELTQRVRTPWSWLAGLDCESLDTVIGAFAIRDELRVDCDDEDDGDQLDYAAAAHVLIRAALTRPELVAEEHVLPPGTGLAVIPTVEGPLHHTGYNALLFLGADAVDKVARDDSADPAVRTAAQELVEPLRAIENDDPDEDIGPSADLHAILEDILEEPEDIAEEDQVATLRMFLTLLTATAKAAGPDATHRAARDLFTDPSELSCLLLSGHADSNAERLLRHRILTTAATLDPGLTGELAAELPELRSTDPRDEPALRNTITTWWQRLRLVIGATRDCAPERTSCPEPGADLLHTARAQTEKADTAFGNLTTEQATIAVLQVVSALSTSLKMPEIAEKVLA